MTARMNCALLLAAALLGGGCQELVVENTNSPDRNRALSQPDGVELLAASTFPVYYNRAYRGTAGYVPIPMTADEGTQTVNTSGARDLSSIPRTPYDNNPVNDAQYALVSLFWGDFYEVFSNGTDALKVIDCPDADPNLPCRGLAITTGANQADNTHRVRVFAKLAQGLSLARLGMIFDQAYIYDETVPDEVIENPIENGLTLKPYPEVLAKALELLLEAARLAEQGPNFTIPMAWLYAPADVSRADLIEFIYAHAARLLVLGPRTPAERQAVNWQAVINYTSKVTKDVRVAFGASSTGQNNPYVAKAHASSGGAGNSRFYTAYAMIGAADVSGKYQAWLNTPPEQRTRFLITTPDRRITGSGGPTTNGKYFSYVSSNLFNALYGTYRESFYQWYRYRATAGQGATTGTFAIIPLDEMKLYRAEALLRTNQTQAAVDLINATRVTNGNLPQITTAGVTQAADCVPKTASGACGSVLDALIYERMVELIFVDPIRTWTDKRGFGTLTTGTVLHLPIPYEQQRILDLPYYTFGGSGPGSAQ